MDYVIIVAGGKGLRMGAEVPKQFLPVAGMPVLMRTIRRFREYDAALGIILVLPHEQQEYWRSLCVEYDFEVEHTVVDGGNSRFESSRNGLMAVPESESVGVIGIHDGVRPFVSTDVIARCYSMAKSCGAVIPVLPVTDTMRFVDENGGGHNVLRSHYRVVQTPQVFRVELLRRAFRQPFREAFTDDASVVEALGERVEMTDGNRENIKLTTPFDLKIAETLCRTFSNKI